MRKTENNSYEKVLNKMLSYCAYQERCTSEVAEKLESYALSSHERGKIIQRLQTDGFINDQRFARIFAGSKFRLKKWGKFKIRHELQIRQIEDELISEALNEIDDIDYVETINNLIINKLKELKEEEKNKIREKTIKYLLSKGFELDLVHQNLTETLKKFNNDDQ